MIATAYDRYLLGFGEPEQVEDVILRCQNQSCGECNVPVEVGIVRELGTAYFTDEDLTICLACGREMMQDA